MTRNILVESIKSIFSVELIDRNLSLKSFIEKKTKYFLLIILITLIILIII